MSTIQDVAPQPVPIPRRQAARLLGVTTRQLEYAAEAGDIPEHLTTADLPQLKDAAALAAIGIAFYLAVRAVQAGWRPPAS